MTKKELIIQIEDIITLCDFWGEYRAVAMLRFMLEELRGAK